MKNSEKTALLSLAGIAVAVLAGTFVVKPNIDTIKATKLESQQLQARLTELQQKQSKRDDYLAEKEEYEGKFNDVMDAFPADLNQEVTIMFLEGIKDNNEFDISSLSMGEKELFYTLGNGGGDANLATADAAATTDAAATDATASTEATTAAATDTTASTEATTAAPITADGEEVVDPTAYNCYRAAFPITYKGSYDSLKNVISYIGSYSDRMTINSIDITYDPESDVYSGNLNLQCYDIENEDRPERKISIDNVETGVSNIFLGNGTAGSAASASGLTKYDENDGAAIESSYDFYAMLNPASSDVSAKVVGQNGTGKEASILSNSDNGVSTLKFEFYEKDGKNYCKYTLDGTSYEAEVTSAEDIKVLLQSSARKGDDDKAGIRVTINNTTSLPVYVKVSGDDTTSARVNIAGKTGSVKIYN